MNLILCSYQANASEFAYLPTTIHINVDGSKMKTDLIESASCKSPKLRWYRLRKTQQGSFQIAICESVGFLQAVTDA